MVTTWSRLFSIREPEKHWRSWPQISRDLTPHLLQGGSVPVLLLLPGPHGHSAHTSLLFICWSLDLEPGILAEVPRPGPRACGQRQFLSYSLSVALPCPAGHPAVRRSHTQTEEWGTHGLGLHPILRPACVISGPGMVPPHPHN